MAHWLPYEYVDDNLYTLQNKTCSGGLPLLYWRLLMGHYLTMMVMPHPTFSFRAYPFSGTGQPCHTGCVYLSVCLCPRHVTMPHCPSLPPPVNNRLQWYSSIYSDPTAPYDIPYILGLHACQPTGLYNRREEGGREENYGIPLDMENKC